MRQNCTFCKNRDFKETSPSLSVDLAIAIKDKVIPSSGTTVEHNDIEKSSSIGIRVRDNFEAIEAQRMAIAIGKTIKAAEKAAAEKAAAEKAAAAKTETSTPLVEGVN